MEILLFLILVVILILAYICGKRDLLSPWFLVSLACFVSYCIILINFKNWEIKINGYFVIYLTTALLAFAAGTAFVNILSKQKLSPQEISIEVKQYATFKYPTLILLCTSLLTTMGYIFKLIIDAGGMSVSFSILIRRIYDNIVNSQYSSGFIFNQMREISCAIAYISMFRLIIRLYDRKDKVNVFGLLIPIILFILLSLISSDRNIFMRFAIFSICVWAIVYNSRCRTKRLSKSTANLQIVLKAAVILVGVLLIFYLFGKIKLYTSNLERMLGIYGGSGLYNFNLWIENYDGSLMYGKMTFSTLLSTLETILSPIGVDFNIPEFGEGFISYTTGNGYVYSSNIYSALIGYVMDFGFAGVIIFPFILGVIMQRLYTKAKKQSGFSVLLFCLLAYCMIYFPVAEQFFGRLHLGFVYEIVWLAIVYYFVYGKKNKNFNGGKAVAKNT